MENEGAFSPESFKLLWLSLKVCEKLKHELIKGWGGKSPPGFKCTQNFRNILSVSGAFTSLCKVEKQSPGLKIPSVVYLAPVFVLGGCFWEKGLSFQPCSGCVCGTGGLARLGSCAAHQGLHLLLFKTSPMPLFLLFFLPMLRCTLFLQVPSGGECLRHFFEG